MCVFFRGLFFYEVLIVVLRNSLWKCVERFDHFSKCSNYEVWLVNSKQKKETFLSHWYLNRHDLFEYFVFNKCSFYFCFCFFVYYDFSLGPLVFLSISSVYLIWSFFFLLVAVIFHSRALSPDMICFYSLFVLYSMFKQFSKLCLSVLFVIYTCFIQEKICS